MRITLKQICISLLGFLVAVITGLFFVRSPAALGAEELIVRFLVVSTAIVAVLVALYPFVSLFRNKPGRYLLWVCLPGLLPGVVYYFFLLPAQAGEGMAARQLQSELIGLKNGQMLIRLTIISPILNGFLMEN